MYLSNSENTEARELGGSSFESKRRDAFDFYKMMLITVDAMLEYILNIKELPLHRHYEPRRFLEGV
jgi:hypothetical protein